VTTENAALGNVVDQKKIVELPLNGRDYLQLAFLQPNVFAPAQNSTIGFRGGLNVAETAKLQTNTSLTASTTTTRRQISHCTGRFWMLYANSKFSRNIFSGIRQAAGGQVIVTTQAGTNAFHGSLWNFTGIRRWMPATFSQRKSHRSDEINLARAGRADQENRTFFFAGYEGNAAASRKRAWRPFLGLSSEMAISAPFQRRSAIPLMEIVRFQETGFLNQCGANRVPGFLRFILTKS